MTDADVKEVCELLAVRIVGLVLALLPKAAESKGLLERRVTRELEELVVWTLRACAQRLAECPL